MEKGRAIALLRAQIDLLGEIRRLPRRSPQFKKWHRDTEVVIERIFGQGTRHTQDFNGVSYTLSVFSSGTPDIEFERRFHTGLDEAESVLESFIHEIEEFWNGEGQPPGPPDALGLVLNVCRRFHRVTRQLRDRHDNRPTLGIDDEYDAGSSPCTT